MLCGSGPFLRDLGNLCMEIPVIFAWPMRALNCEDTLDTLRHGYFSLFYSRWLLQKFSLVYKSEMM